MSTRRHSTSSAPALSTRNSRVIETCARARHNSSATSGLHQPPPIAADPPGFASNLARAQEIYDTQVRILASTGYLQQLEQSIIRARRLHPSLPVPQRGVCLALSHVAHFVEDRDSNLNTTITGLTQLAVFDTACRSFGIPRSSIKVYDPWFTEADRAFLHKLDFDAPRDEYGDDQGPKFPALEVPTLVFHPNLILPALFQANFSPKHLSNLIWLSGNQRSLATVFGKAVIEGTKRWAVIDSRITATFDPSKRSAMIASSHALPNYHFHVDRKCQGVTCPECLKIMDDTPWRSGERRLQDYGLSTTANTLSWWPQKVLETLPVQFWQVDDKARIRTWP